MRKQILVTAVLAMTLTPVLVQAQTDLTEYDRRFARWQVRVDALKELIALRLRVEDAGDSELGSRLQTTIAALEPFSGIGPPLQGRVVLQERVLTGTKLEIDTSLVQYQIASNDIPDLTGQIVMLDGCSTDQWGTDWCSTVMQGNSYVYPADSGRTFVGETLYLDTPGDRRRWCHDTFSNLRFALQSCLELIERGY